VHLAYHGEVDGPSSSGPYSLVKQPLDVRLSAQGGAIVLKGTRVASHPRSPLKGRPTTVAVPRPKAHQPYAAGRPPRLGLWAAKTGEAPAQVIETSLASRPHPPQGFRACLGSRRRGTRYGEARLEAAGGRALRIGACSYKRIASILTHARDQQPWPAPPTGAPVLPPSPIRGAQSYHPTQGDPGG
jgi:hypothetical protein